MGQPLNESPEVKRYRFAGFELDGDALELRRDGEIVSLRPQAARVLRLLLDNAGRLVSRDEIRDRVWGPDSDVDFDHSLHTAIRQVRAALGESGEDARLIQTYPRRGYRFEAEVEVERPRSSLRAREPAEPDVPPPSRQSGAPAWRIALAVLAAVFALTLAWSWWRAEEPAPGPAVERIALSPFRALGDDPSLRQFSDGLDAELAGAFSRIADDHTIILALPVGLEATERQEMARSQSASLLLSGAVRSSGDGKLRITVQLLRVVDGAQLWADTYEENLDAMLMAQSDLAERIVSAVHAAVHESRP
jgi:DNA-binding winged helix-turn-helix (wHTH) protein/TolB-like protein